MIPRVLITSAVALALNALPAEGQVRIASSPQGDYLLEVTRKWGESSRLGDLQTKAMRPDDIEVRLWYGYGITYTSGIILRREGGRWTAESAIVHRCLFVVPDGIEFTPEIRAHYEAEARQHCGEELPKMTRPYSRVRVDTLEIKPLETRADLEIVWRSALRAGILEIPPEIPREWGMADGFTWVLEVRQGDEYRASRIEAGSLETDADYRMEAIAGILSKPFDQECNGIELIFCRQIR